MNNLNEKKEITDTIDSDKATEHSLESDAVDKEQFKKSDEEVAIELAFNDFKNALIASSKSMPQMVVLAYIILKNNSFTKSEYASINAWWDKVLKKICPSARSTCYLAFNYAEVAIKVGTTPTEVNHKAIVAVSKVAPDNQKETWELASESDSIDLSPTPKNIRETIKALGYEKAKKPSNTVKKIYEMRCKNKADLIKINKAVNAELEAIKKDKTGIKSLSLNELEELLKLINSSELN
ncbi:MAG: hypothetical protein ACXVDW_18795 [Bacteroidia bacterium]